MKGPVIHRGLAPYLSWNNCYQVGSGMVATPRGRNQICLVVPKSEASYASSKYP